MRSNKSNAWRGVASRTGAIARQVSNPSSGSRLAKRRRGRQAKLINNFNLASGRGESARECVNSAAWIHLPSLARRPKARPPGERPDSRARATLNSCHGPRRAGSRAVWLDGACPACGGCNATCRQVRQASCLREFSKQSWRLTFGASRSQKCKGCCKQARLTTSQFVSFSLAGREPGAFDTIFNLRRPQLMLGARLGARAGEARAPRTNEQVVGGIALTRFQAPPQAPPLPTARGERQKLA